MKTKLPWILTVVLAIALVVALTARPSAPAPAPAPAKKALYWVDPMHPSYKSDRPGKAPDCGMDLVPVYEAPAEGVTIPSAQQQLIGVATAPAERRALGREIRTVGRVAVDETRIYKVSTKFDGYIETLYVSATGQAVSKGQPLFTIYSPDLLASQQEYLLARRAAAQSPTLLEAARQRLKLWDISDADLRRLDESGATRKTLTIAAPAGGFVMNKTVVAGARVAAGEPLFEIAPLDRVWIQADVYESELPYVSAGAPAAVTLAYIPGRSWNGKVTFVAPAVDPTTRTVKVRIELANADGALKPDMFAEVVLQQPPRDVIAVPASAVLDTGTRTIVYVADGRSFQPRAVRTGAKSDGFIEIREGLKPGERVVTEANFLVDSEARLKAEGGGAHD